MECQRCQYENRPGVKYCLKCGTKLELQWPQCGKRLPSAAVFCDECGFSIPVASETTPINYSQPHSYIPKYLADKILSRRQYLVEQRFSRRFKRHIHIRFRGCERHLNLSSNPAPFSHERD